MTPNLMVRFLCLGIGLMFVVQASVSAQPLPKRYPQNVDLGVNGIYLNFRKSAEDTLAPIVKVDLAPGNGLELECLNADKTEKLVMNQHPEAPFGGFQVFSVIAINDAGLDPRTENVTSPDCYWSSLQHFESERGIKLGISINQLTEILGDEYRIEAQAGVITLRYALESNEYSSFLRYYKQKRYIANYIFRNRKLSQFSFGFD